MKYPDKMYAFYDFYLTSNTLKLIFTLKQKKNEYK